MAVSVHKPRLHTLDLVRGIVLVNMVIYHLCFDLVFLFGVSLPWFGGFWSNLWQQSICCTFIFCSGISSTLSHSNTKRGFQIFALAMVLSLGSYIAVPEELIVFGILHFIGIACILTGLCRKLLDKIPPVAGFISNLLLFLLTKNIFYGYIGIGSIKLFELPEKFYSIPALFVIGLPTKDFFSSDYFSLMPWIFLFWAGFFFWKKWGSGLSQSTVSTWKLPFFNTIGCHTLFIYMIHQPVLYALLLILKQLHLL